MVKYFCDICGKEITKETRRHTIITTMTSFYWDLVVCEKCFDKVRDELVKLFKQEPDGT